MSEPEVPMWPQPLPVRARPPQVITPEVITPQELQLAQQLHAASAPIDASSLLGIAKLQKIDIHNAHIEQQRQHLFATDPQSIGIWDTAAEKEKTEFVDFVEELTTTVRGNFGRQATNPVTYTVETTATTKRNRFTTTQELLIVLAVIAIVFVVAMII